MSTLDLTNGPSELMAWVDKGQEHLLHGFVDFAVNNVLASDVVQLISIPAGSDILAVYADVLKAEGATLTFEVGDDADPNGWVVGVDGDVVAYQKGAGALAVGKLYITGNTIDLLMNDNAVLGQVSVTAHAVPRYSRPTSVQQ